MKARSEHQRKSRVTAVGSEINSTESAAQGGAGVAGTQCLTSNVSPSQRKVRRLWYFAYFMNSQSVTFEWIYILLFIVILQHKKLTLLSLSLVNDQVPVFTEPFI